MMLPVAGTQALERLWQDSCFSNSLLMDGHSSLMLKINQLSRLQNSSAAS
jgi:hypothetical protein